MFTPWRRGIWWRPAIRAGRAIVNCIRDGRTIFGTATIVILPDNDEPGRKHAVAVATALLSVAASIRIVELPGLPAKGDMTDWRDAGGTLDQFRELVAAAEPWTQHRCRHCESRWSITDEEPEAPGRRAWKRRTIGRSWSRSKASFRPCRPFPKSFSPLYSVPWCGM